jgi:hypothetical protein
MGRLARVNINMSGACVIMMGKCPGMMFELALNEPTRAVPSLVKLWPMAVVDYGAYDVQDGPWT